MKEGESDKFCTKRQLYAKYKTESTKLCQADSQADQTQLGLTLIRTKVYQLDINKNLLVHI